MENNRVCKGCLVSTKITDSEINQAIEKLSRLKNIKFVDDTVYENRLKICGDCSALEYGTTCLHCGCIVQIKAKLPDSFCPYPKNRKW